MVFASPSTHVFPHLLFLCVMILVFPTVMLQFDYLDVDLNTDVKKPTEPSCDEIELRRKRSQQQGLNQTEVIKTDIWDNCLVYSDPCPDQIKVSWLHSPPFVYNSSDNKTENISIIRGILADIFTRTVGVCCRKYAGVVPSILYRNRSSSLEDLQRELFDGRADAIFPIHSDDGAYWGDMPYVKIVDSPGVILITKNPSSSIEKGLLVWYAIKETWPVVFMAFLMSSVAGVFIWVLDASTNSAAFPRNFHRGVFEGFWWAYVTITTVGYGDKTPKSTLAKLFSVLWITIGLTVCSVMTATLTSALTKIKIERYDVTSGKKIGVLRGSVALQDAVDLAANITTFEDLDDSYDSLAKGTAIDGILEELFTGVEQLKTKRRSKTLAISKFIWHKRAHGVAYRNYLFTKRVAGCIANVIKFRTTDVLEITSSYLRATEGVTSDEDHDVINVFDSESPIFVGCAVALSVFILVVVVSGRVSLFVKRYNFDKRIVRRPTESTNTGCTKAGTVTQDLETLSTRTDQNGHIQKAV